MDSMQVALLRAVRASRSPMLYGFVFQNLGQGVPPSSILISLITKTRSELAKDLFGVSTWTSTRARNAPALRLHQAAGRKRPGMIREAPVAGAAPPAAVA